MQSDATPLLASQHAEHGASPHAPDPPVPPVPALPAVPVVVVAVVLSPSQPVVSATTAREPVAMRNVYKLIERMMEPPRAAAIIKRRAIGIQRNRGPPHRRAPRPGCLPDVRGCPRTPESGACPRAKRSGSLRAFQE